MTSVTLETANGVATLTLRRPDSLNAFDLDLAAGLRAAAESLAQADVDVLVIAGEGRAFSAGGDVRQMAASGDAAGYLRALTRDVHAALAAIRELPVPVIARVHGPVAGGGLGLVLAADIAVAAESATFTAAYGALGLSPDCGVTALLPKVVGAARARAFLLGGLRLDAVTAREWGLVARTAPAAALDDSVADVAERARGAGRAAVAATKALLADDDYRAQLDRESAAISELAAGSAGPRIEAFAGGGAAR